jgi:osmotically-inducible protein OsmY
VRTINTLTLACLLGLLVGSTANAQNRHTPLTDQQISDQIEHKLSETDVNPSNVKVTVQNGVVTLSGTVPSAWAKRKLIDRAREVDDVQSVVDNLSVPAGENDRAIAEEVAQNIRRYVFYTIYDDVQVQVKNGVVTLTGRVTMPYKAQEIANLAARARGVREVDNRIQTLPVSGFDDQLRASIASQIYGDPLFWNYALQVNPPIHIVVENGRVTLTGVVNSEVEKRKAEAIARSAFGVLGVENLLQVERRQSSASPR